MASTSVSEFQKVVNNPIRVRYCDFSDTLILVASISQRVNPRLPKGGGTP